MTVEITSTSMQNGVIRIGAVDVSEENLMRCERMRDDFQKEIEFVFDLKDKLVYKYIINWLQSQKAVKGCKTYGEALNSILGTVTQISGKYRVWDY